MPNPRPCVCCAVPPHMLRKLATHPDPHVGRAARGTLAATAALRTGRQAPAHPAKPGGDASGARTIFDMRTGQSYLAAIPRRAEGQRAVRDVAINRAFDSIGTTRRFCREVFGRNSLDGAGMELLGYVHYNTHYSNAVWNGHVMLFGDGDGKIFGDFTGALDIVAHELAHGVIGHSAGLEYHNEPGALNESIADVFASLVKQWSAGQTAAAADWLIGTQVFTPAIAGDAIRSLKAPGRAYNNKVFGKDPQVAHMRHYAHMPDTPDGDNGGVHVNSGIPNKAFYLFATHLGGYAWEAAGHIWYEALLVCGKHSDFQFFADATFMKAGQLYGTDSQQQKAVLAAWGEVGIAVRVSPPVRAPDRAS